MNSSAHPPTRAGTGVFYYSGYSVDPAAGMLECTYELGRLRFVETFRLGPGRDWGAAALQAARLVYLLAGVSYYKAGVPPVLDLGDTPLLAGEAGFLRDYYVEGLAELAYRNGLDLSALEVVGGRPADAIEPAVAGGGPGRAVEGRDGGALVPFGGGMDSIVTAELVREAVAHTSLFVMTSGGRRFDAIEAPAALSGLPVSRAERDLDPQILASGELGLLNGHVPVTAVVSAVAVLAAALEHRDLVVMSNERSASAATLISAGRAVNHQWSKSLAFEEGFAAVVRAALGGTVSYFSYLRPCSELWVAERLSRLGGYLPVFRSCNRAFHVDPARRLTTWCGVCDKCCFVDLVLAPFLPAAELAGVFGGSEPLSQASLGPRFAALLGISGDPKPFECVGDVEECRSALVLAAARPDRSSTALLHQLVDLLGPEASSAARALAPTLLRPDGPHHIPDALLAAAPLV